ncbi:MAG: efflux RND transporter periplasmic adaptor subunit, partial [Coriobacteriales bacterium]|nr:efflux RND transporter periplasmic adaptor subunit [Coriobacteriales bacterium]
PEQTVSQSTDFVFRDDFVSSIRATGKLMPFEHVTISPEVDGTVVELFVSEGDSVEEGQLLFSLENPDLDKAITQAQRGVDNANLALRGAQTARNEAGTAADKAWSDYVNIKKALDDSKQLAPDDPLLEFAPTQADVDMVYAQYRASISSLDGAKLSLESAQMSVSDAEQMLQEAIALAEKRHVYAPISGQVVVMNLERGTKLSTLATTGQLPMQIADISQMRMSISVNEIDILEIKPGMSATVYVDALPDYMTKAEVLRVASTTGTDEYFYYGPSSGLVYYSVDLLITNPDPRLKIGMSASADVITLRMNNVLLVNSMAIQSTLDSTYVLVLDKDGNTRPVDVKVIVSSNSLAVIEGDIRDGDEVLLGLSGNGIRGSSPGSVTIEKY